MDMIRTCLCLDYFHFLLVAEFPYNLSYIFFQLPIYFFSPVFGRKDYMIFTSVC